MQKDFRLKIWEKEVQRCKPGYEGLLLPSQMGLWIQKRRLEALPAASQSGGQGIPRLQAW